MRHTRAFSPLYNTAYTTSASSYTSLSLSSSSCISFLLYSLSISSLSLSLLSFLSSCFSLPFSYVTFLAFFTFLFSLHFFVVFSFFPLFLRFFLSSITLPFSSLLYHRSPVCLTLPTHIPFSSFIFSFTSFLFLQVLVYSFCSTSVS